MANNIYIIKCGGLYYSQKTIHEKINFKNEAIDKNIDTVIVSIRYNNNKLSFLK